MLHEAATGGMRDLDRLATLCLREAARKRRKLLKRDILPRILDRDGLEHERCPRPPAASSSLLGGARHWGPRRWRPAGISDIAKVASTASLDLLGASARLLTPRCQEGVLRFLGTRPPRFPRSRT